MTRHQLQLCFKHSKPSSTTTVYNTVHRDHDTRLEGEEMKREKGNEGNDSGRHLAD